MNQIIRNERNLIFCAYARDQDKLGSVNVRSGDSHKIYLQCAAVALISAKVSNSDAEVALVTNTMVDDDYRADLQCHGIQIFVVEFDLFTFPSDYKWGLAFYKLCALVKMLERGYSNYLLIDTDTFTQSSLSDFWPEAQQRIMLYGLHRRSSIADLAHSNDEISRFYSQSPIPYFGGEFIGGSHELMSLFAAECAEVYRRMLNEGFVTTHGDEFIIRIAAHVLREHVADAGGYVERYWTGGAFYLTSTKHIFDPVSVIHVPGEKRRGLPAIYRYYRRHGHLPPAGRTYRALRLPRVPLAKRFEGWLAGVARVAKSALHGVC